MRNSQLYISLIVLGVIVFIIGILLFANVFGPHHTLPYIAIVVGAILAIIGIIGKISSRPRSVV